MPKLSKWEVSIEYGPAAAADVSYVTVEAESEDDAMVMAHQWAKDNSVRSPVYGTPCRVDDTEVPILEDDFTDILEWTPEEEDEFVRQFGNDNGGTE